MNSYDTEALGTTSGQDDIALESVWPARRLALAYDDATHK